MSIESLLARLGSRAQVHAPLGSRTTYRVGGTAALALELDTLAQFEDLAPAIAESGCDVLVLGNGSNLLVEDGEREVVVVHFSRSAATLDVHGDNDVVVRAGAGLDLPLMARRLSAQGVVGFEWAVGVPGTVGGAVAMNAGGHGDDVAGSLLEVTIWRDGASQVFTASQLELGYRTSAVGPRDVVLEARFSLSRGDRQRSEERVREIVRWRRENQPGGQNAGSVFRNPEGDFAARLVEVAQCKGLRLGSAQVSDKHANFIQADAGGVAVDVYSLISMVKTRVNERCGVELVCENRFVGFGEER